MKKYERYLSEGYQKILSFQRPEGGFDWWGRDKALVWLSAYGLMQLTDLSEVYPTDSRVTDRIVGFLLKEQDPDGSWKNFGRTHGELMASLPNPSLTLTAYTAFALASSKVRNPQLDRAIQYLKAHREEAKENAYLLGLVANALLAYEGKSEAFQSVLQTLLDLRQGDDLGVYWKAKGSLYYSRGQAAQVETTALIGYSLIKSKSSPALIQKIMGYLLSQKDSRGSWGSTQATILALKTLAEAAKRQGGGVGDVKVLINNQPVKTVKITKENQDLLHTVDLSAFAQVGTNIVKIEGTNNLSLPYQVVTSYYLPWQKEKEKKALDFQIQYSKKELEVDELINLKVSLQYNRPQPTYMVVLKVGIPAGFEVLTENLEKLVGSKIERFEASGGLLTLYLGRVAQGESLALSLPVRASGPLKVKTPPSVAYEYYSPEVRSEVEPVELLVKKKD